MSKFNSRVVPLLVCSIMAMLFVGLATTQLNAQAIGPPPSATPDIHGSTPDPSLTAESTFTPAKTQGDAQPAEPAPAPTPTIDWATIELPPHDPPLAAESFEFGSTESVPPPVAAESSGSGSANSPPPVAADIVTDASGKTYVVQPGDTLYSIARRFGLVEKALVSYNGLVNPNLIYPGQELRIPAPNATSPATPDTLPTSGKTYVVQPGDTLYGIARRVGVTVQALVAINSIANPKRIYPGMTLQLLGSADAPPASPPPTPTPALTPTPSPPADGKTTYVVLPGDSLYEIARRFGVTVKMLARVNQLNNWWLIYPGQVLVIPSPTDELPEPTPIPDDVPYIWPVDSRAIVKGYRYGHQAIDIVVPIGTSVLALADGVVEFAGWNSYGYGNLVVVNHGNGIHSLYAHHDSLIVATGQTVKQGEALGLSGSTGNSTMPHLHLEIRINQSLVNPCLYLPDGC